METTLTQLQSEVQRLVFCNYVANEDDLDTVAVGGAETGAVERELPPQVDRDASPSRPSRGRQGGTTTTTERQREPDPSYESSTKGP